MKKNDVFFRRGTKVLLRPLMEQDVPQYFKWMNNPELTQFLLRVLPMTLEEEREWYERSSRASDSKFILALCDRKTGALIGSMGMHDIDYKSGTAITGSMIGEEKYRGRGYGTEGKMLLLDFAFRELNLRKIYSHVIGFNTRSFNYAKKCGYVEEARLPNHYYRNGKYWDQITLAVYRDHWEPLAKKFFKQ